MSQRPVAPSPAPLRADELRKQAEQRLAQRPPSPETAAWESTRQLHELRVHQIELEMQNEALLEAQAETGAALQRLVDLTGSLETLVATRTRELVQARDAAEAASSAKSRFLSNMSHELRTPLGGLMGMVELSLNCAIDTRQIKWLQMAKTSGEHLLAVVNDVLDISKIDAGRLSLNRGPFTLEPVLDEVSGYFATVAESKRLAFSVHLPEALGRQTLYGDSFRLKQILLNLLGNAFKFTTSGGVELRVQLQRDGAQHLQLRFEVHDSGIGIAPEAQARLFRAFEQADDSTSRRFGGTGLGLVISEQLARMMAGSMGVDSQPNAGSSFWFTAVFGKSAGGPGGSLAAEDSEMLAGPEFSGQRVLLVEDDPASQTIARVALEHAGLQVDLAKDGAAALAMATRVPYALIVMDVHLPVMAGDVACRAIRQLPGHVSTPIIALTAGVMEADRQRCFGAGMNDHVSKPIRSSELLGALRRWMPPRAQALR